MAHSKRFVASALIVGVLIITAIVNLRSRKLNSLQELGQPVATNVVSAVQTTQASPQVVSRPQYGKASLSEEEKKILYTSFENMYGIMEDGDGRPRKVLDSRKTVPQAYRVGMICLKHRLNWSEVQGMIHLITGEAPPPRPEPPNENHQFMHIGFNTYLVFRFDREGSLESIRTAGSLWYKFPPMEQVTPDTPIDPPQKPANWGT